MTGGSDGPRPEFKLHPFQRHSLGPIGSSGDTRRDQPQAVDSRPPIDLDATEPDRNPHIREYVMALYRRRWIAARSGEIAGPKTLRGRR